MTVRALLSLYRHRVRLGLLIALALLAGLPASTTVQAAPALRVQVNQHGDFVLIGNTFGQDCAAGTPGTVLGTVGSCGVNTADSAPDIYWRADSPSAGQAEASISTTPGMARTSARLILPPGAEVTHAYLYWSATLNVPGSDSTATLDRPGVFSASIAALETLTGPNNSYRSVADVTTLVQSNGPGAYRVSDVNMGHLVNQNNAFVFGAWWMVVLYELGTEPLRNLTVYDGLDMVVDGSPQNATISGFEVPASGPFDAKLGVVAMEGDNQSEGDALAFNGTILANHWNPANNFFNGTRSHLGEAVSEEGDLPQLTGEAQSMSGIDLDVVDITPYVTAGQTSASLAATTLGDVYFLTMFVTSITTVKPEIEVSGNSVVIASGDTTPDVVDHTDFGSVAVSGGTVVHTFTITNTGNKDLILNGSPVVAVSGANAGDFTATLQPADSVAVGSSTEFQITFDPSVAGVHTATVTIANNDSDENPYTFAIQGEGQAPSGVLIERCFGYEVRQLGGGEYVAEGWSGPILVGTLGNDIIPGKPQPTLILGLGGKDKITGKGGNDVICGGQGDDWLIGNAGNDSLDGGIGNDKLVGSAGFHDVLVGGDDNDSLSDVDGVAQLSGGPGVDTLSAVFKNGWVALDSTRTITNITGGYENDKVNLSLGGRQPYLLNLSGDENDNPASPLEGTNDRLTVVGPVALAPTIIKFEQQTIRAAATEEIDEAALIAAWRAAGEWVDENDLDEVERVQTGQVFLPLINK